MKYGKANPLANNIISKWNCGLDFVVIVTVEYMQITHQDEFVQNKHCANIITQPSEQAMQINRWITQHMLEYNNYCCNNIHLRLEKYSISFLPHFRFDRIPWKNWFWKANLYKVEWKCSFFRTMVTMVTTVCFIEWIFNSRTLLLHVLNYFTYAWNVKIM